MLLLPATANSTSCFYELISPLDAPERTMTTKQHFELSGGDDQQLIVIVS
jgi:hypothetical protein